MAVTVPHSIIYFWQTACDDVISANTFERLSKNTYDHVPIPVEYKIPEKPFIISDQPTSAGSMLTQKVNWSRISDQDLKEKYHGPLSVERTTFDPLYHNDIEKSSQSVTNLILHHSINVPLIKGKALTTSDFLTIFELLASLVAWHLMNRNFLDTQQMTQLRQPTIQSVNHIAYYCEIFLIIWKSKKSQNCAMPLLEVDQKSALILHDECISR